MFNKMFTRIILIGSMIAIPLFAEEGSITDGLTDEEKNLVISEAKEILDVEDVIASILLVDNLRIQKN